MIGAENGFLAWVFSASAVIILVSAVAVFWRLLRGPTAADRIVALDMLGIQMVAFAAVFAVSAGETAFLDVALSVALVAFLGTVAFARYLERTDPLRREAPERREPPIGVHPKEVR